MGIIVTSTTNFFEGFEERATAGIRAAIANGCLAIEADAKKNCPVDTGNLRASISNTVGDMEGEVGSNVEYANFVELGTKKMSAQPFLHPAFEANKDKIIREIRNTIGGK